MSTSLNLTPEELQAARHRQALSHQYGNQFDRGFFWAFVSLQLACFVGCTAWGLAHGGALDALYGAFVVTLTLFAGCMCLLVSPDGWADVQYLKLRSWYAYRRVNAALA